MPCTKTVIYQLVSIKFSFLWNWFRDWPLNTEQFRLKFWFLFFVSLFECLIHVLFIHFNRNNQNNCILICWVFFFLISVDYYLSRWAIDKKAVIRIENGQSNINFQSKRPPDWMECMLIFKRNDEKEFWFVYYGACFPMPCFTSIFSSDSIFF